MMAARGMAPLPPVAMVCALYGLAWSDDPGLRDAAFVVALEEARELSLDDIEEDEDGGIRVKEGARKAEKKLEDMNVTEKIRTAMLGNSLQRSLLIRSTNRLVAAAVLDSPKISDDEVIKIAASRNVSDDILRRISSRGAWLRLYEVKLNLVSNPKTPIGEAMKLIVHLRESDMKRVATSKNVAAAVRSAAGNHLKKRK
jgi:hypothetical protein